MSTDNTSKIVSILFETRNDAQISHSWSTETAHLCFWEVHRTRAQDGDPPATHTVVDQGSLDKGAVLDQDTEPQNPLDREGNWNNLR